MRKPSTIVRQLTNIANGSESRLPLWTVMDNFTIKLLREAAKTIKRQEAKLKKRK